MYLNLAMTSTGADLPSGKMPTTRVRLRISRFGRSMALQEQVRCGIDESEPYDAAKLDAIRDGLRRGASPEQIAATRPSLGLSAAARRASNHAGGLMIVESAMELADDERRAA